MCKSGPASTAHGIVFHRLPELRFPGGWLARWQHGAISPFHRTNIVVWNKRQGVECGNGREHFSFSVFANLRIFEKRSRSGIEAYSDAGNIRSKLAASTPQVCAARRISLVRGVFFRAQCDVHTCFWEMTCSLLVHPDKIGGRDLGYA